MFTGIVQAVGVVRTIQSGSSSHHLVLDAPELTRPIADGSSICVSGVCLTVTQCTPTLIEFDIVPETLSRSTLGSLRVGDQVNLERSLRAGDPLDGHIVQGHVDGVGVVETIRQGEEGWIVEFQVEQAMMPFIAPKGSIALDGVSLTIAAIGEQTFRVALIPTTLAATTLKSLRQGDRVNVETDIVARTIVSYLRRTQDSAGSNLSLERLQEEGWS
jgi:riboflavin synthase